MIDRPVYGLVLAGDYLENASINGAMSCGRRAAAAVLEQLQTSRAPVAAGD